MARRRCEQIKTKYRARFQDQSHDDDGEDDDDDPGSDFEGRSEGEETESDANDVAKEDDKFGRGGSDDPMLKNAPDGMEVYQRASAWYHVAYSNTTNPFIAEARKSEEGRFQGTIFFLSFPWICAYQQLCQIKEMSLRHRPSGLP